MRPRRPLRAAGLALLCAVGALRACAVGALRACAVGVPTAFADGPADAGEPWVVRDDTGKPIAGAEVVEAGPRADGSPIVDEDAVALALADANGRVAQRPVASGAGARLVVRHAGRATAVLPDAGGIVTLRAAAPLSGRLSLADGSVPAAATVVAVPVEAGPAPALRVRPDAAGRFTFAGAAATAYRVEVLRTGGATADLGVVQGGATIPPTVLPAGAGLRGRVLDADGGKPATGLVVRLVRIDASAAPATPQGAGAAPVVAPPASAAAAAEAVVDAEGRLQVADVPRGVFEGVLADPSWLWDGDVPRVEIPGSRVVRLETWWVRKRGTVLGVVRGAKDRLPVEGALVRVVAAPDAEPVPGGRAPGTDATTDAAGRFRVNDVAPGTGYRVVVRAPGRAAVVAGPIEVVGGRAADVKDVLLWPGARLDVVVVSTDGRPLEGARVVATPATRPAGDASDPVGTVTRGEVRTDAAGAAALVDLPDGEVHLRVSAPGYVDAALVTPELAVGGARSLRVTLAPTATIAGRVEATDGPVPPVELFAIVRGRDLVRRVTPGPDGAFAIGDLPPEPTDVEAHGVGPAADLVYARREGVIPGSGEAVVLPVPSARRVTGSVTGLSPQGAAPRVRLEIQRPDPVEDLRRPVVVLDRALAAGSAFASFELLGVPPGVYALRVVQGARDSGPVPLVVDAADVDGLSVRLPDGATVAGEVVDATVGGPALGARVELVRLEGAGTAPDGGRGLATVAGEDGRFEVRDVAPGLYRVEATDRERRGRAEVRVGEGEAAYVKDLRLADGGRVEGTLSDERHRPMAGVPIEVLRLPALESLGRALTAEDGTFRTAALDPGAYRLRVTAGLAAPSGIEADVEVFEGETTRVDWTPQDRGRLDGAVRRRATAIAGVAVEVVREDALGCLSFVRRTLTDAYGQFAWEGLGAGLYTIRIVDGAVRSGVAVRLGPGDHVTRDVELGEGRISGVVRFASGEPVRDAEVEAVAQAPGVEAESTGRARARSGPDGTFSLPGLAVGRYRLLVTPEGRPTRVLDGIFADLAGSERVVDVWMGVGARLEVDVRDDRGRGLGAAEVWVEDRAGVALHPHPYVTAPSGRLTIEGLPEGAARVRARARGFGRPAPVAVTLKDGATASARIAFKPGGRVRLTVTSGRDPVARARVDVLRQPSGEPLESRRTLRRPDDASGFAVTPRTGVLLVDDLEEGSYTFVVSAGRELAEARVSVTVRAGRTVEAFVALVARER